MRKLSFLLMLCLAVVSRVSAQTNDEKAVADAVEFMRKAMIEGDKAKLEKVASDDLSYGHSSGVLQDKAAFVDQIVSKRSVFVSIDLTEQTIKVRGNTAIVRHKLNAQTNDGGKPGTVALGVLLVFQKQKGEWKLLARQAFKLSPPTP